MTLESRLGRRFRPVRADALKAKVPLRCKGHPVLPVFTPTEIALAEIVSRSVSRRPASRAFLAVAAGRSAGRRTREFATIVWNDCLVIYSRNSRASRVRRVHVGVRYPARLLRKEEKEQRISSRTRARTAEDAGERRRRIRSAHLCFLSRFRSPRADRNPPLESSPMVSSLLSRSVTARRADGSFLDWCNRGESVRKSCGDSLGWTIESDGPIIDPIIDIFPRGYTRRWKIRLARRLLFVVCDSPRESKSCPDLATIECPALLRTLVNVARRVSSWIEWKRRRTREDDK